MSQSLSLPKTYPEISMMESAEDRPRSELAGSLDRRARRILFYGQTRSEFVATDGAGSKDAAQMGCAEDNDVIEAFPAD
jgi:hypothetical protein